MNTSGFDLEKKIEDLKLIIINLNEKVEEQEKEIEKLERELDDLHRANTFN
jgi:predicted RNase H-like nuclease (RuvC/YqgF family)